MFDTFSAGTGFNRVQFFLDVASGPFYGCAQVYPGYPHGMCTTHADVINKDLLEFIQS